jgi:hypothetical protein
VTVLEEERRFASDAEAVRYYAARLYDLMSDFIDCKESFHSVTACASILRHFGVDQERIELVIRVAAKNRPFPFSLFRSQEQAAA